MNLKRPSLPLSLFISFLTWPLFISLSLFLYILGWVLVPLALVLNATEERYTVFNLWRLCFSWPFMAPWQNYEDGIGGPPYYVPPLNMNKVLAWSCVRNPVNGLRWLPILSTKVKPENVQYIGTFGHGYEASLLYEKKIPSLVYVWQGPYSCVWLHFSIPFTDRLGRLFLGHKLYANDAYVNSFGYRQHGTGFAAQFKVVQKGDNKN